jgi:hypothetical protein
LIFFYSKTKKYRRLAKQDWLAEVVGYSGELQTITNYLKHSTCFVTLEKTQENKPERDEKARFFVLPQDFFQDR